MAKNEQKVKVNPYHFRRFWPIFQLFKNGTKRAKKHLNMLKNNNEGVSLRFRSVFKVHQW